MAVKVVDISSKDATRSRVHAIDVAPWVSDPTRNPFKAKLRNCKQPQVCPNNIQKDPQTPSETSQTPQTPTEAPESPRPLRLMLKRMNLKIMPLSDHRSISDRLQKHLVLCSSAALWKSSVE